MTISAKIIADSTSPSRDTLAFIKKAIGALDEANVPVSNRSILYLADDGCTYLIPSSETPDKILKEYALRLETFND